MNNSKIDKVYNKNFYTGVRRRNNKSAEIIVPITLDIFTKYVKTGSELAVVDLGCGTGNWLNVYNSNFAHRF